MLEDRWAHPVTTASQASVDALSLGFSGYFSFKTDALSNLNTAIEADPDFSLPHAAKGILLESLKKTELHAVAQEELDAARNGRTPASSREQHYLFALEAVLKGNVTLAATHYQLIVAEHPHDLFAMRLAQSELFWIGEIGWMRDISEAAAPYWAVDDLDYADFLSIRAFGLEENGDYKQAERYAKMAIEMNPADCWAAHCVAHVQIMQGRFKEGAAWLSELSVNWSKANHIVHHLWWHAALFHIESSDHPVALDIYDNQMRNLDSPLMQAIPDFYIDIQNDAALLQRLEFCNIDVGDRWAPIAELALPRIDNLCSPFTSAHCALALAADGRFDDANELVRQIQAFIAIDTGPLGSRYSLAVLPVCKGIIAYYQGNFDRVIDLMLPARRNLWQMGGSHAQRDLFFQLLVNAAKKAGRIDVVSLLIHEIRAIGFDHLEQRSSYVEAMTLVN